MEFIKKILLIVIASTLCSSAIFSATEQIKVDLIEEVNQEVIYNPLSGSSSGIWAGTNENQSRYDLSGYIIVTNSNPTETLSDIYVSLVDTTRISLPTFSQGRAGTFIGNNVSSGVLVLHIPELLAGENSTWEFSGNASNIIPPLNLTTAYSDSKLLAGDVLTITDTIVNEIDNSTFLDTCVSNIILIQTTAPVDFSGTLYNFSFNTSRAISGSDSANAIFNNDQQQTWNLRGGSCLNKTQSETISYDVISPYNIPASTDYIMTNTTFQYDINHSLSSLSVGEIKVISEAKVSFEKAIVGAADPLLYGSNVTWNITGEFSSGLNITYNLSEVTLWVSQRNVNGSFTDPNTIDVDTISGAPLNITYFPNALVNSSLPWMSSGWQFNYSDLPSPIVWMDVNYSIADDGAQLIDRSVSRQGDDFYIKELYLIVGYWLEINKNITAISTDKYHIRIDVHNKGNQVTPAGSIVTIYDFIPNNFIVDGNIFTFSSSTWYNTDVSNNSVVGEYNGTLHQWALTPTNVLNTSFAQGPSFNSNTTWSVDYNVTGSGDYTLLDVFVTGLDPQKVDGAGGNTAVVVSEILDRISSTEGIFAAVASVLLLLGLLL
jgi:hypothetical protein